MANHQPLDNVTHQHLRVSTQHHPKYGDNQSYARLVLSELAYAQSEYPIFLRKQEETGQFEVIAMLGMAEQENLFVDKNGWHAHYVPLSIQRRPFLIGYQQSPGQAEPQPTVHVDMDSPRVNTDDGQLVFLEQGGQSDYLQHVSSVLRELHQGLPLVQPFVDMLQEYELIEPVSIDVQLDNGDKIRLGNLYGLHEENLAALDAASLGKLNQAGYLKSVYMLSASMHNLTKLIERKNALG